MPLFAQAGTPLTQLSASDRSQSRQAEGSSVFVFRSQLHMTCVA